MKKLLSKLWRRQQTPQQTPEERIRDLREYRTYLLQQVNKTNQQIADSMAQRVREAGLGA